METGAELSERRCPHCGQPLSQATILCPSCQTVVIPSAPEWTPPPVSRAGDRPKRKGSVGWGFLASALSAAILIGITYALYHWSEGAGGVLVSSDFVLVPFVMGLVSAFCWKGMALMTFEYFLYSLVNAAIGVAGGAVFMGEGAICLVIVSPLLLGFTFLGGLAGRWLFARSSNRLNFSLIPLATALLAWDVLSPHHYENAVTDTVTIHAPPSEVWSHLAAVPPIPEEPDYWLFKLGLPYPTHSNIVGQGIGAKRECVFSRHCVFEEKVVAWEPNHNLTFDVTAQPRDPEILGHARVKRGQFLLRDNHNGTTTLVGTSWYELYVYPSWYYDLWASAIARQVHLRVMDHVKTLSEQSRAK